MKVPGVAIGLNVLAVALNVVAWVMIIKNRRRLKALRQFQLQTIHDAFRAGLEAAATTVATLAERPYDTEPEFSAMLNAERAIHELIRDWSKRPLAETRK